MEHTLIPAVQDYDRASSLATEAHQRQEFALVFNEILGDNAGSDGNFGNKSKGEDEDSFGLIFKRTRSPPTLFLVLFCGIICVLTQIDTPQF